MYNYLQPRPSKKTIFFPQLCDLDRTAARFLSSFYDMLYPATRWQCRTEKCALQTVVEALPACFYVLPPLGKLDSGQTQFSLHFSLLHVVKLIQSYKEDIGISMITEILLF